MPHLTPSLRHALAASLLGFLVVTAGCTTRDPNSETPCSATSECSGKLCVDGHCTPCGDDNACAQDPMFGAGATCGNGSCTACKGKPGCACDGTTCETGSVCKENLCVSCPQGSDGCPCFGNNTCNNGLTCTDGTCGECPAGSESCACLGDGGCSGELECMANRCVQPDCVRGQVECPCRDDVTNQCNEGLTCMAATDTCEICTPDTAGCACASDDTCRAGLVCNLADRTCRVAMTCQQVMCGVQQVCMAASAGMDARCLEQCNAGYQWNATSMACEPIPAANCNANQPGSILTDCDTQNRVCTPTQTGAMCGSCKTDFVDENGNLQACRAAVTCATVEAGCTTQHRVCTPHTTSVDATCGACATGYTSNSAGACVEDMTANCRSGDPNSILDTCTAQNKTCQEAAGGATCGGCITGYALETTGSADAGTQMSACVRRLCSDTNCAANNRSCSGEPLAVCGACLTGFVADVPGDTTNTTACRLPRACSDVSCPAGKQCLERMNQDPICADWPCVDAAGNPELGKAYDPERLTCVDCGITCTGEGEIRLWPETANGQCVCETQPGYYVELGGLYAARPCDRDDDGWTRIGAAAAITSGFDALVDNARCSLRTIDRFRLVNEFKQELDVMSCAGGFVPAWGCATNADCGTAGRCNANSATCECSGNLNPLELYESTRNDDQDNLDMQTDTDVPKFAETPSGSTSVTGRRLRASEINALTKACISSTGDYNDNGADDIAEWQGEAPSGADADTIAFTHFSYFVETHHGAYEKDVAATYGRYLIQERSRCDASFPLTYAATDGTYWKECVRNRDVEYDRSGMNVLAGYDFAEFSCAGTTGTCTTPAPATGTPIAGEITDHGLCDPGVTLPPVDNVWRGMGHHSQFKCIQALSTVPADRATTAPHKRLISDLENGADDGELQLTRCRIACPSTDPTCATDCTADGGCTTTTANTVGNPDQASITCETVARSNVVDGEVGFAAVRFLQDNGTYERGCINEWQPAVGAEATPWKSLCPGYSSIGGTTGQGNPYNFGKLLCGCTFNYGGASCNVGCVDEELHVGGDCTSDLTGYCTVDPVTLGRRGWWMCGAVTTSTYESTGTNGPVLAETADGGWRVTGAVASDGIARQELTCDVDAGGCERTDAGVNIWKVW